MGSGSWKSSDYLNYASTKGLINADAKLKDDGTVDMMTLHATHISARDIYSSQKINQALDPKGVKVRESRDSAEHPFSNAIILGLDVTGSMANVLKMMAQTGVPKLMEEIYKRAPVQDPQVMYMAIGDIEWDQSPLQVTQFESDIRILQQLELVYLEQGGGGNNYESYTLPWLFAADHTSIDCFEKRQKKGYIFTFGDEEPTPVLRAKEIEPVLGYKPQHDWTSAALLERVSKKYEVYHLMVAEGSHMRSFKNEVIAAWEGLLGPNALLLSDHTKLAETIVSTIQIREGADPEAVVASWEDKQAASVVAVATKTVKKRVIDL